MLSRLLPLALLAVAPASARAPRYPPSTGQSALYACADGRQIEVLYSGGDAAVLTIAGRTVQLGRTTAARGERYVGEGWQWLGVGVRDGALSRAAADADGGGAGVACHVR